jgi:MFS transporter, DHA2 family, multidrug resistance protein
MSAAAGPSEAVWVPRVNPWIIALAVMSATFMEILDTSVANVSLPHIAGNLSATTDEATWVLTSYLVANAIVLPATAWLGSTFGRKRFLVACIGIFTLASVLSGAATSLGMLVVARVLQGLGGGALQPMANAILLESFPPHKRGQAMAAYGMGVVVAPIIGPTLGGWITDSYSWRWIFYINLPVGVLSAFLVSLYVEDPPYIRGKRPTTIDYVGFGLMAVGLGALQILLDKGQQEDWFASPAMTALAITAALCLVIFVIWELRHPHPIVNLSVFKNRNFAVGTVLITIMGIVLFGTTALLPLFLQNLLGYSALQSGLSVSPRGFGAFLSMIVVGRLISRIDARWLIASGFGILSCGSYALSRLNADIGMWDVIWPNILSGLALGAIFVPLTTVSNASLPNELIGTGTGLFNLMRNVGGSVGISLVTTFLERSAQVHQSLLSAHTTTYDAPFRNALHSTQALMRTHGGSVDALSRAHALLYGRLLHEANLLAFIDNFSTMAAMTLACVPAVLLLQRVAPAKKPVGPAH